MTLGYTVVAPPASGGGGSSPDADASTKGVVQLAGDLGGSASSPTVPGKAAKLTVTATKTTTYTAAANELVPVSAASGPFTVTLPTGVPAGTVVAVRRTEFGGNTVTVSRGGTDTIAGSATLSLGTTGGVTLVFDGTSTWTIQTESQSLTGLDGRYNSRSSNLSDVASAATARTNLSVPARVDLPHAAADSGVLYNGSDQTTNLQAALTAAAAARGTVTLTGSVTITGTITVPAGVTVRGVGPAAKILVAAGFNYPALLIDGVTASVQDLTVQKAAGAVAGANGAAVRVAGNSDGARISNVTADGMSSGFYVAGQLGTTPGTVKRVVFDRCRALNSDQFGFQVDECDGLELAHCSSNVSGLDGVKLRRKAKNVVVTGGYYTGAVGGDGMDCYAGGDSFVIQGASFIANGLNGLVVKNDDLNRTDAATYGYVRTLTVANVIATGNGTVSGGSGIAIHRSSGSPDDVTEPLVTRVNVTGCQTHDNVNYGLYLNARAVTVTGLQATRNGLDGLYMEPACLDVTVVGPHVAGNSVTTSNTRDGIHVNGNRIQILGGSSTGSDPDGAIDDAALAAGTKTQRYGLRVEAAATNVDVYGLRLQHNNTGPLSDASGGVRWAGPAVGNYLTAGRYSAPAGTRSTVQMLSAVEYAVPFYVAEPGLIVRIGIDITIAGTAGTVIRLGIRADLQHLPGAVLADATVAGDAIATPEATIAAVVDQPGIIWLTATAQSTGGVLPTVRSVTGPTFGISIGSLANALGATPNGGYTTAATVTGALPGTYTVSNRAGALPLLAVRA
jgi:hypothetical protein